MVQLSTIILLLAAVSLSAAFMPRREQPPECKLSPESGPCEALSIQFFYNATARRCQTFKYGGCGGNRNRFSTIRSCYERCHRRKPHHRGHHKHHGHHDHHDHHRHHGHRRRRCRRIIMAVIAGVVVIAVAVTLGIVMYRKWKATRGIPRQRMENEPTMDFDVPEKKSGPPPPAYTIDASALPPAQITTTDA